VAQPVEQILEIRFRLAGEADDEGGADGQIGHQAAPFGDAWFAPPEAVIVSKLLFYREGRSAKHLEDIGAMLAAGSVPDRAVLLSWIVRLGLGEEWSEVVA
jgi:hypothetical protein